MKLLVFQHIECEHPGSLRSFLAKDGIAWDAVELDQGEAIPDLRAYDALWVMGGPMDVWDEDTCPWLIEEKAAIHRWVLDLQKPYLGLCLGHQLLADALGGKCTLQKPPEIGIFDIELTDAGRDDPLFYGLPERQKCLQWHSVQVSELPKDAEILARSDLCEVQAMRVGLKAWSMQYHVELESGTIDNWAAIPAYYQALINSVGEEGYKKIKADSQANMQLFLDCAEKLCHNFIRQVG